MHGKGTFNFADGGVYKGEFINDKICGKGEQKYANGDVYEGML